MQQKNLSFEMVGNVSTVGINTIAIIIFLKWVGQRRKLSSGLHDEFQNIDGWLQFT